jgi:hypothetical protein
MRLLMAPPQYHRWNRKSQIERQIGSDFFMHGTRRSFGRFVRLLGGLGESCQPSTFHEEALRLTAGFAGIAG